MNILTGTARLARDAEVRVTQGGTSVCSFTAAMDSGYGDNKAAVWLRMSLFGKRASGGLPQYLVKGCQIAFSGELKVREYDDKDGNKRASVEVNVDKLDLIGGNASREASHQSSGNGSQQRSSSDKPSHDPFADSPSFADTPVDDDSIPF